MTEEKTTDDQVVKGDQTSDTVDVKTDNSIPYSRFQEVNSAKNELQTKLDEINAKLKTDSEKKMAEEGKKDELIASLTSERDGLLTYKTSVEAEKEISRQALIKEFPEAQREKFKDYSLGQLNDIKSEFLNDSNKLNVDGSPPSGDAQSLGYATLMDAARAYARMDGTLDEKGYVKVKRYFENKIHRP